MNLVSYVSLFEQAVSFEMHIGRSGSGNFLGRKTVRRTAPLAPRSDTG